mmetsp:Transcript_145239/g.362271  ORF Transcript_145239/g.362271 Transcript_145239/m.362271 type:complete len:283 (+) Transcript_145239:149-997(+)
MQKLRDDRQAGRKDALGAHMRVGTVLEEEPGHLLVTLMPCSPQRSLVCVCGHVHVCGGLQQHFGNLVMPLHGCHDQRRGAERTPRFNTDAALQAFSYSRGIALESHGQEEFARVAAAGIDAICVPPKLILSSIALCREANDLLPNDIRAAKRTPLPVVRQRLCASAVEIMAALEAHCWERWGLLEGLRAQHAHVLPRTGRQPEAPSGGAVAAAANRYEAAPHRACPVAFRVMLHHSAFEALIEDQLVCPDAYRDLTHGASATVSFLYLGILLRSIATPFRLP